MNNLRFAILLRCSMQLLVQQLSPVISKHGFGIETLETGSFVLQAYRAETGVQFFVTADLKAESLNNFLVRWTDHEPV